MQTLAPKYEQLAKVFAGESNVLIAKVDATENQELATTYGVKGYPTIKFFPAGSDKVQDYEGGRELADFVTFLNENAGTHRALDGSLLASAGRIPALDEIVFHNRHRFYRRANRDKILQLDRHHLARSNCSQ